MGVYVDKRKKFFARLVNPVAPASARKRGKFTETPHYSKPRLRARRTAKIRSAASVARQSKANGGTSNPHCKAAIHARGKTRRAFADAARRASNPRGGVKRTPSRAIRRRGRSAPRA